MHAHHIPPSPAQQVEFRPVPGFPGYCVGNDGSVWSRWHRGGRHGYVLADCWRRLTGGIDKDGYRKVILCAAGRRRYVRVASLILEVFVGPCPPGLECCHDDGNAANDRLTNLRWDTHRNNVADKRGHGTHQAGERHGMHKLTADQVREIRRRRAAGEAVAALAREFGVWPGTVSAVVLRRLWKDLDRLGDTGHA
jgi:hypothetical protein